MSAIMKPSEIYRKAARMLEKRQAVHTCSCLVIQEALGRIGDANFSPVTARYIALFKPDGKGESDIWGNEWAGDENSRRDCRVLALCFMVAIAEDSEITKRRIS